jgi:hypothetical protein
VCSYHAGAWGEEEEGEAGSGPWNYLARMLGAVGEGLEHLGSGSQVLGPRRWGLGSTGLQGEMGNHLAHKRSRDPGCE